MKYRRKPIILKSQEDLTPENIERVLNHVDEQIREQDGRRISQISAIQAGSTDSETTANLLSGLNSIITTLNNSELTEDD